MDLTDYRNSEREQARIKDLMRLITMRESQLRCTSETMYLSGPVHWFFLVYQLVMELLSPLAP